MKTDGFPTYHLANVVDDHLMKITHVIRGEVSIYTFTSLWSIFLPYIGMAHLDTQTSGSLRGFWLGTSHLRTSGSSR